MPAFIHHDPASGYGKQLPRIRVSSRLPTGAAGTAGASGGGKATGGGAAETSRPPGQESVYAFPQAVGFQERRRRRRAMVPPMYTHVAVRILARPIAPLEGHVIDVSENGMAIEIDSLIPVGQPVTVEFRVAGLGTLKQGLWAEYAAAAEVVRHDQLEDFPRGPYRIAVRFAQLSTMTQAQIARFVAMKPG